MARLPVEQPEAVFFSNSKLFMVDPDALEGFHWFNAAFGAATVEEIAGMVSELVRHGQLCVIAVDFWQFHADHPPVSNPPPIPSLQQWLTDYLLSLEMAKRSLVTAFRHRRGDRPLMAARGFIEPESFLQRLRRLNQNPAWLASVQEDDRAFDGTFVFAETRIALLQRTVEELRERGIQPIVLLHPQHPRLLARLESPDLRSHHEKFKKIMRETFPGLIDLTGQFPQLDAYVEGDPMHYRPEIGVQVINEIVVPVAHDQLPQHPL